MFIQESKLNLSNTDYPGLKIHQIFFTDGDWDCTNNSNEAWNSATNTEVNRLFAGNQLTQIEQKKFNDFEQLLSTLEFTS
jgi:hypothetical protein